MIADYDVTSELDMTEYEPNRWYNQNSNNGRFSSYTYNWGNYKFLDYTTWFDFIHDYNIAESFVDDIH
jgi:hypothetical protein